MAVDIYSKTVWNNGTSPSLSKTQLDHIEDGIKNNNTAIISLQSVQAECENYASEALSSKISSASSATASASSALSALASANTAKSEADRAKDEADRAVAVVGIDIATDTVAGLIKSSAEIVVDENGTPTLKQTDTSGLVGTVGLKATLQSLIDYIADAVKTKLVKISDLKNNLTTVDSGYALDARQGKILNDSLTTKFSQMGTTFKQLRFVESADNVTTSGTTGLATITLPFTPSISATNIPITCITSTSYQGKLSVTAGSKIATVQIWKDSAYTPIYSGWIRYGVLLPCAD